jgi:hypothetical protein
MTQIVTTTLVCDLCAADIYGPDRRLYRLGVIQPVSTPGAMFRNSGHGSALDLCDDCAAPLAEALQERVLVLRAEGRLKAPRQSTAMAVRRPIDGASRWD